MVDLLSLLDPAVKQCQTEICSINLKLQGTQKYHLVVKIFYRNPSLSLTDMETEWAVNSATGYC